MPNAATLAREDERAILLNWTVGQDRTGAGLARTGTEPFTASPTQIPGVGEPYAICRIEGFDYRLLPGSLFLTHGTRSAEQWMEEGPSSVVPPGWGTLDLAAQGFHIVSFPGAGTLRLARNLGRLRSLLDSLSLHHTPLRSEPKSEVPAQPLLKTPNLGQVAETLTQSLGLTYDDLEAITGVSRSTFLHWKRVPGVVPRASTSHRLLRFYAIARAIVDKLGPVEAGAWLRSGSPSKLDALKMGDYESVERELADMLFSDMSLGREEHRVFRPEADFEVSLPDGRSQLQRSKRSPRRARLPRNDR